MYHLGSDGILFSSWSALHFFFPLQVSSGLTGCDNVIISCVASGKDAQWQVWNIYLGLSHCSSLLGSSLNQQWHQIRVCRILSLIISHFILSKDFHTFDLQYDQLLSTMLPVWQWCRKHFIMSGMFTHRKSCAIWHHSILSCYHYWQGKQGHLCCTLSFC